MEDPKAVIVSAIESLDRWLMKKADRWEHSYERLANLVVGMSDFGEENKETILSFMAGMADSWEESKGLSWWNDPWVDNKKEMFKLVIGMMDLGEEARKKKMYGLVAGMAEFWEDNHNNERLCSLLLRMAYRYFEETEYIVMSEEYMVDLVVEIAGIWGVDKENLHNLLAPIVDNWDYYARKIYKENMYDLVSEMGSSHTWKLNKEKIYTWLASKVDLLKDEQMLFGLLLDVARYQDYNTDIHELTKNNVEGARNELKLILDFITENKLEDRAIHHFISDAVEIASDAHCLIKIKDSDPFILLHQMFIVRDHNCIRLEASKFSKKIKLINNWLQETKERMLEFGVEKAIRPQHDVGKGSKDLVGLEADIDLLLHMEDFGTITFIKGMIGSGKTTLAREVYNRAIVDGRFERCAWVCVSRKFSRKEILMSLLLQVVDKRDASSFEKMDNKSLNRMVRQHLEGKRYFIVFDDVCEEAYMKFIVKAFPQVEGSRLLLTTCNTSIRIDHCRDYNHHMRILGDDDSWQLLLHTLLFYGVVDQKFPKNFMKKGIEMLKKCNGLPLAIKEVGRQWANKRQSGIEWEELLNEAPNLEETLKVLESTYNNFDKTLKSCFLHLAFFKEGVTIKAERLVRIWSAGGLELERWELTFLSNESIIQVMDEDTSNVVKTCRIHAVFHKLAIIKAQQELGLEILHKDGNNRPSHEARHRVIYCSREMSYLSSCSMNKDKYLVSLFYYGGGYFDASPYYWQQFEQLKILDMEDFGLKILPDAIGTLIELRYLGLRNNYLQELPHSLARLKKLEVLDIALNFMVLVPDIIWDMDSLCHVYISDITCDKPLRIDALEKLETLNFVSIDSWTYELSDLKKTNLFRLGIEAIDENSDVRRLFVSLAELKDLSHLILRGFRFRSMPSLDEFCILERLFVLKLEGQLKRLPSANNFPQELRYLTLVNSSLDEDPMPILENLVNLEYLKLQNAYTGQQMVFSPNRFCGLYHLVIGELWHLRNIQVAESTLWRLEQLEIYSCPYLEILPKEILLIESLEKLKLVTTKSIATKIRESGFLSRISEVDIQL